MTTGEVLWLVFCGLYLLVGICVMLHFWRHRTDTPD